ncbi:hypothetical protein MLD38_004365 [Melastoma candidum]|uniref:Uncharacterized protein n=1 Tax=Melastoma candidum TaxID=119954 RepID=A0ACB9SA39_9MYRT|nr:hypothetical protein MLD38_004365 [Melastoma candidum]
MAVKKQLLQRVSQIPALSDNSEEKFQKKILKERTARLSGDKDLISSRELELPTSRTAKNAGVSGSVVIEKVLSRDGQNYGYNAAKDCYEDLLASGIMDPTKCCLEHSASVAKTLLTSDAVVVEIKEPPMSIFGRKHNHPQVSQALASHLIRKFSQAAVRPVPFS